MLLEPRSEDKTHRCVVKRLSEGRKVERSISHMWVVEVRLIYPWLAAQASLHAVDSGVTGQYGQYDLGWEIVRTAIGQVAQTKDC